MVKKSDQSAAQEEPSLISQFLEALSSNKTDDAKSCVQKELDKIIKKHNLENQEILFLYDESTSIGNFHADTIYAEASKHKGGGKNITLIVNSLGGRIEPAYLISKALKRISADKFVVVVPRRAKSAATLISLGADEIHMGMTSELGPIDPQLGGLPALSLGNALDVIAEIVCRHPGSADLLTEYIKNEVPIRLLGYYKRVNESAAQYAERLLASKKLGGGKEAHEIANHLVNHYKDHSFVIDYEEASDLLGPMIQTETSEYLLADEISRLLNFLGLLAEFHDKEIWIVGGTNGFGWRDKKKSD